MTTQSLVITEIYQSIQGESAFAGFPCIFIRLTGCPLRCAWCDTAYAFKGGRAMSFDQILDTVRALGPRLVELTGGEPLAQEGTPALMARLVEEGYQVLIETSGSEPIETLPPSSHVIMDIKCPGSGMADRNRWENLAFLKKSDEVKFVLRDRADFDWAMAIIAEHHLNERCEILLSAAFGLLAPKDLVAWMLEAGVRARLNLQQHKYIWGPRVKGV